MEVIEQCKSLLQLLFADAAKQDRPISKPTKTSQSNGLHEDGPTIYRRKKRDETPIIQETPQLKISLAVRFGKLIDKMVEIVEDKFNTDTAYRIESRPYVYNECADIIGTVISKLAFAALRDGVWCKARLNESDELCEKLDYMYEKFKTNKSQLEKYREYKGQQITVWRIEFSKDHPYYWLGGATDQESEDESEDDGADES
jgi:hypothetical protein